MKARVNTREMEMYKQFQQNVADVTMQTICAVLYAFELQGYRKKRLQKIFRMIKSIYEMPPVLGKQLEADDVFNRITETYDIDFTNFKISTETFEEFCQHLK